jgi:hypothetical protein
MTRLNKLDCSGAVPASGKTKNSLSLQLLVATALSKFFMRVTEFSAHVLLCMEVV